MQSYNSKLDSQYDFNEDDWVVTQLLMGGEHAAIGIEGVDPRGKNTFLKIVDFLPRALSEGDCNRLLQGESPLEQLLRNPHGPGRVRVINVPDYEYLADRELSLRYRLNLHQRESWIKSKDVVEGMIQNIINEQANPPHFRFAGKERVTTDAPDGHNCITWVLEKLELIDIKPGKKYCAPYVDAKYGAVPSHHVNRGCIVL